MGVIFVMDEKNYTDDMPIEERFTVRAVIERDGKLAMQRASSGDYKIPGGGMDPGEDRMQALKREVLEETGLIVIPSSVKEIGMTREIRRDCFEEDMKFIRHTFFYSCSVEDVVEPLHLTPSEEALGYRAVWAYPEEIIRVNRASKSDKCRTERDTRFLEWYVDQKKLKDKEAFCTEVNSPAL